MRVESVEIFDAETDVFDIGVKDNHNYFIYPPGRGGKPVLVHNCHNGASAEFARVIAQFRTEFKIGLSATPQRKDAKEVIVYNLLGPVVHETKTKSMVPQLLLTKTGLTFAATNGMRWTTIQNRIERNPQRLKLIVNRVVRDLKNKHMILIPVARVDVAKALSAAINKEVGENVASPFVGSMSKQERRSVIARARSYKLKVIVGQTTLLSVGLNIPRASALYIVTPSNNLPNAEQKYGRVLTPYEDKPQPIYRIFADNVGVCQRCFTSEYWGAINPLFRPKMSDETRNELISWMKGSPTNRIARRAPVRAF
jgi:superfamily II DNA or RNA helicase